MPELEAKVTLQVTHNLPYERATVEEERRTVQRVRLMPVALSIRHPYVLLALHDKPFPEPLFEFYTAMLALHHGRGLAR